MRYMHTGWEPDESGDAYARDGESKSLIYIYAVEDGGEVACIVHRHMGPLNESHPVVAAKLADAERIVARLNGSHALIDEATSLLARYEAWREADEGGDPDEDEEIDLRVDAVSIVRAFVKEYRDVKGRNG